MPSIGQVRKRSIFILPLPKTRLAAALILPCFLAVAIQAEDWPQWRGPNRDGVWKETGILESFPPDGLKVRWRASVGFGWSSPVVAQGRVYVTDSQLMRPKANERVHCFEESTGKLLWTHSYDAGYPDSAFTAGHETRTTAPPIVQDGKLYTLGKMGHLFCLDVLKGKVLWQERLDTGREPDNFNCDSSPLIEGDFIILVIGGKPGACVVALDKNTGKEAWQALDDSWTYSSPLVISAGGKRQLIVWTVDSMISLDPATGKTYWRQRLLTNGANDFAVSSPVFHENRLLIGSRMFRLDPDKPTSSVLWPDPKGRRRKILSNTSTALIQGDCLYTESSRGHLVCLEAGTGKQVWESDKVTDLNGGASIHLTPNGDSVFLYTDKGELIRARLSSDGYKEIGRARLIEPSYTYGGRKVAWTPPAYANRCIFARNDKEVICASLAKP